MSLLSTSAAGLLMRLFELLILLYLLRMAAIRLAGHPAGQGLAAIVF